MSITMTDSRLALILRVNAQRTVDIACYDEHGAYDRFSYLEGLADDHGLDMASVLAMADALGPDEDFDGLVTHLEDGFIFQV